MTGALLTVVKSREVSIEFINDKFLKCKQQCVMTIIYGGLECNIHFSYIIHGTRQIIFIKLPEIEIPLIVV